MSSLAADLQRYARFAVKLRAALRHPMTLREARGVIERRMAERDRLFLVAVEHGVFRNPRSPYLPLLKRAGAELGDIAAAVKARGLEGALDQLRQAGVYATLEEFKGRIPIKRGDLEIRVAATDFDNPNLAADYAATTGGTTGPASRVGINLDSLVAQTPHWLVAYDAHGVLGAPMALWRGALPDGSGMNILLRSGALFGQVPEKWFAPFRSARRRLGPRLMTEYIIGIGRWAGIHIPRPEVVTLDQAVIVARWAQAAVRARGSCLLRCNASMSMRVAVAAREHGIGLAGVTFFGGGEPPTPAKVREITSTGARWVPTYSFTEGGGVGCGCARPSSGDDVHLFKDVFALIQAPHRVAGSAFTVPAFYVTSLTPTAPKVLLNAEIGDYGVVETRACGCPFGDLGFTEHVRDIRSFGLLVSDGFSIMVHDTARLIDEILPARFGGSPLDYQLTEDEDERGFTRLTLTVSPRVTLPDDGVVVAAVTDALGGFTRAIWPHTGTLRIRRGEPTTTGRGKSIPLQLAQRGLPESREREP
jgi:hypothetical protein